MYSLKSSLRLWLKQQSNAINHCAYIVLWRAHENDSVQFESAWPENYQTDPLVALAVQAALQKKRLHLAPAGEQKILLAHPIIHQEKLWGAVVLCVNSNDKKDTATALKQLQHGMLWLQFMLMQEVKNTPTSTAPTSSENAQTTPLLLMLKNLLAENSLQEAAISFVNFIATQMQSSRVCLGLQGKNGIELTAVSFSANFDKRTSAMQAVSDAMDEAADQRINILVTDKQINSDSASDNATDNTTDGSTDKPNHIQRYHEQLLKSQQVVAIKSVLLRKNSQIIGVVTLEYKQTFLNPEQNALLMACLIMATDVIALKQQGESNIRQQIQSQTIKKLSLWFGQNKLTQKLIGAAVFVLFCILFFPANYWLSSDASLQSTYQYVLVSPQDSYLTKINVRPGAQVKKGDVLAQLNDEDLRLERRKIFSQLQQSQQEYDNALANANRVQAAIANEKIAQANAQLSLVEQQQLHTQLLAPSDGIITSDDISQSLGAPVKQGQLLFEIAANQGYLVHLMVNESNIAAVKIGQKGHAKLTSLPNETFEFTVQTITPLSEIREGKNYFRVDAKLDQESNLLRPGMTGSGKILAGRKLFGWIWFHEVWDWLRLTLWL